MDFFDNAGNKLILALAAFSELVIANNYQASKLNELSEKLDKLTKTE